MSLICFHQFDKVWKFCLTIFVTEMILLANEIIWFSLQYNMNHEVRKWVSRNINRSVEFYFVWHVSFTALKKLERLNIQKVVYNKKVNNNAINVFQLKNVTPFSKIPFIVQPHFFLIHISFPFLCFSAEFHKLLISKSLKKNYTYIKLWHYCHIYN